MKKWVVTSGDGDNQDYTAYVGNDYNEARRAYTKEWKDIVRCNLKGYRVEMYDEDKLETTGELFLVKELKKN